MQLSWAVECFSLPLPLWADTGPWWFDSCQSESWMWQLARLIRSFGVACEGCAGKSNPARLPKTQPPPVPASLEGAGAAPPLSPGSLKSSCVSCCLAPLLQFNEPESVIPVCIIISCPSAAFYTSREQNSALLTRGKKIPFWSCAVS